MNRIFPTLLVLSCLTSSSTAFAQTASAPTAEIVNAEESAQAIPAAPATRASGATQGPQIAPTPEQLQRQRQRAKEAERQQALKAKVDAKRAERLQALKAKVEALQAEITALKNGEPTRQIPPTQAREK